MLCNRIRFLQTSLSYTLGFKCYDKSSQLELKDLKTNILFQTVP